MPIGRMLNKKISYDEKLNECSLESQLLFTWCIPHLDVKGRIFGDCLYLKGTILPINDNISVKRIQKCLQELQEKELILIYGNKIKYIQFLGFNKNQHINEKKEAPSTIPDPDNSRVTPDLLQSNSALSKSESESEVKININSESEGERKSTTHDLKNFFPLFTLTFGEDATSQEKNQLSKIIKDYPEIPLESRYQIFKDLCQFMNKSPGKKTKAYLFGTLPLKMQDWYAEQNRKKDLEFKREEKLFTKSDALPI